MLMYPVVLLNHEGFDCDNELVVIKSNVKILKVDKAKVDLCKLVEERRIRLYAIDIKEYSSNSGHHRVDAVFIKPFMVTKYYDFYIAEPLHEVNFKRKRFATPYEIFNAVALRYMYENPDKVMPRRLGAFCWKVLRGYYKCLLLRQVGVDEFLAEAEEFTAENLFDILPHL